VVKSFFGGMGRRCGRAITAHYPVTGDDRRRTYILLYEGVLQEMHAYMVKMGITTLQKISLL
jgi:hypothetical protein